MKIYFTSRDKARQLKTGKVIDSKDSPSVNGSRWAVSLNRLKINSGKALTTA